MLKFLISNVLKIKKKLETNSFDFGQLEVKVLSQKSKLQIIKIQNDFKSLIFYLRTFGLNIKNLKFQNVLIFELLSVTRAVIAGEYSIKKYR